MEAVLAILVGILFASALYTLLRRSVIRLAIGLVLLGHAANLLIFTAAGPVRDAPPLIAPGEVAPPIPTADPLPQALILTAIVISFGVLAFALVLIHRVHEVVGTDDLDAMTERDSPDDPEVIPDASEVLHGPDAEEIPGR